MYQVFDDPTAALAFLLLLFSFLFGLWITRERKEPPKPDSIWWEFKQK